MRHAGLSSYSRAVRSHREAGRKRRGNAVGKRRVSVYCGQESCRGRNVQCEVLIGDRRACGHGRLGVVHPHLHALRVAAHDGMTAQVELGVHVVRGAHRCPVQLQRIHWDGYPIPVPVIRPNDIVEDQVILVALQERVEIVGLRGVVIDLARVVSDEQCELRRPGDGQFLHIGDNECNSVPRLEVANHLIVSIGQIYECNRRAFRVPYLDAECERRRVPVCVRRLPCVGLRRGSRRGRAGYRAGRCSPCHALRHRGRRKRVGQGAAAARSLRQHDGRDGPVLVVEPAFHGRRSEGRQGVIHAHLDARRVAAGDGVGSEVELGVHAVALGADRAPVQLQRIRGDGHAIPVDVVRLHRIVEEKRMLRLSAESIGVDRVVIGLASLVSDEQGKLRHPSDHHLLGIGDLEGERVPGFVVLIHVRGVYAHSSDRRASRFPYLDTESERLHVSVCVRRTPCVGLRRHNGHGRARYRASGCSPCHALRHRGRRKRIGQRAVSAGCSWKDYRSDDGVDVP